MLISGKTIFALSIMGALLVAGSASAADPQATSASAVSLYEQGVDLAGKKDFTAAEAKFLAAWAIQRSYDVAANLGEVEMQLGKPAEAAGYFTYALANFPLGGKPQTREWIAGRLKEAKSKSFALTIAVNVPGADVRVNGKPAGKAPIGDEMFLPAGDCTVEVAAPDYEPWSKKIPAAAGGSQKVQVDLVQPQKSVWPSLAAGGAGIATLAVGVVLVLVSNQKYDEAGRLHDEIAGDPVSPDCRPPAPNAKCAALKSAAETSDALQAPGIALLTVGSLLTAAGGAYLGYALRPPSAPATTGKGPRVTALGVRGAGVFVEGSF